MTCNQLMVLLDVYRGTFRTNRHMGTVASDVSRLFSLGLITLGDRKESVCTEAGRAMVERILATPTCPAADSPSP